jgi:hypothetical protein
MPPPPNSDSRTKKNVCPYGSWQNSDRNKPYALHMCMSDLTDETKYAHLNITLYLWCEY